VLGGLALFCGVLVAQLAVPQFKSQLMLLALVAVVLMVAGVATRLEPKISLSLSSNKLRYFHRYGQWSLPWESVVRVFQPSFSYALERRDIHYIGIKLSDVEVISERISPRLASRLIHEQRDILVLACQQGEITQQQLQLNFSSYKMPSGFEVTGPIAAWLHQVEVLHQAYGAHLFVPTSCFSQSADELIKLLNEYKAP